MKYSLYIFLLLLFSVGCVQKFQPTISSPPTGYLVVEGIINSFGPASVNLSRTNLISDSTKLVETGAAVEVEGNDNSVYPFSDKGQGVYANDSLSLSTSKQYRLHIKTSNGKEYLSDFVAVKNTPAIDSINWVQNANGVQVYANTHDPQNNSIYYQWSYEETWEFHSKYFSDMQYDSIRDANGQPLFDAGGRPEIHVISSFNVNYAIYFCWRSQLSSSVLINSTVQLGSDVVANFPLVFIPQGSEKLEMGYDILVRQHVITLEAYNFLQIMKKNTEETGSIFSAQPSQLQGNVHCVSNPSELVVGYVGFSTEQTQHLFINASQINNWRVDDQFACDQQQYRNVPDEVIIPFSNNFIPTLPVDIDFVSGAIISFDAARAECVDCRLHGTNQKPSFWPL